MKTTESGGPRCFDARKRVRSRKRHIATDTLGLMVGTVVHPADAQDCEGAPLILRAIRHAWPWMRRVFTVGRYAGL